MGKGRIISGGTNGLYTVAIRFNRERINAKLARLDDQISSWTTKIAGMGPGPDRDRADLELAALKKLKAYYEAIPEDQETSAWCADLTENLSGDVGTIEIGGQLDPGKVLVRPGFDGRAVFSHERDGQLMHVKAMTPAQVFYNLAMAPGWQRWMPTYRLGRIISKAGDRCEVRIDPVLSHHQGLDVTGAENLVDVGIEYMDCNGAAFQAGDRVVVEYRNRSAASEETPVVIGFESDPKPCGEDRPLYFILNQRDGDARYLHWYDVDGQLKKTVNLTDDLGVSADMRFFFMSASADMNSIFVMAFFNDWRGYTSYDDVFDNWWPVRVPVEVFTTEAVAKDLVGVHEQYWPETYFLSPGGTQLFCPSGVYSRSDVQLYAQYALGEGPHAEVTETILTGGAWSPPDYDDWEISAKCPSSHADRVLLAVMVRISSVSPTVFVGAWIMSWPQSELIGNRKWYEQGMTGGFLGAGEKLVSLSSDDHNRLAQIICHDGRIYAFFDGGSLYPKQASRVHVYDFETGDLLRVKVIHPWYYLDRVSLVTYRWRPVFCYRLFDVWGDFGADPISPMQVLDAESLEIVMTVELPALTAIAVNAPVSNYMLSRVNTIRAAQPLVEREMPDLPSYYQPVQYLGYSELLSDIAHAHLAWCAANCRLSHEDADGELVYARALPHGIYVAGENLAYCIESTPEEEIDTCISGWQGSPGHFANMVEFRHVMMGYAAVRLPATCATLTLGSGLFTGSGYTEDETVIEIPENERGKVILYCQVFAGG